MVETHPAVLTWLGSPHPLRSLPATLILLALLFWMSLAGPAAALARAGLFACGVLYWTFVEYAIHRWVYHHKFGKGKLAWFFETFHIYHHRQIQDRRVWNAGPLLVFPLAVALLTPVAALANLLLGNGLAAATFGLGTVVAYYAYEWVHFGIHDREEAGDSLGYSKPVSEENFRDDGNKSSKENGPSYILYMRRYHLYHHAKPAVNFGNTSPLWDLILGTYESSNTQRK